MARSSVSAVLIGHEVVARVSVGVVSRWDSCTVLPDWEDDWEGKADQNELVKLIMK